MILNHCRVLFKQKQVHGVSKLSCIFFLAWGFWNIFYYPHLGQILSFAGALFVVAANALWVSMMMFYDRRKCRQSMKFLAENEGMIKTADRGSTNER